MSILVNGRLKRGVWNLPPLDLKNGTYSWKGKFKILRVINVAEAGVISFNPLLPVNTLTTLNTGDYFEIDSPNIVKSNQATWYTLDNGLPTNSNPAVPTITSLSASSVAINDTFNVTGTNLTTAFWVVVGNVALVPVAGSVTSTNAAVVATSALAVASGQPIRAVTAGGYSNALSVNITSASTNKLATPVIGTPSVTATTATFTWGAIAGANQYFFRLNSGTIYPLGNVLTYQATGLTAGMVVTGEVYASDTTGTKANSDYSILVSATTPSANVPTITSFAPPSGIVGSTTTIYGTNFTGATQVSINNIAVASYTVDSATQITAILSNSQVTGKVRVTTANGIAVSAADFTVTTVAPTGVNIELIGNSIVFGVGAATTADRFSDVAQSLLPSDYVFLNRGQNGSQIDYLEAQAANTDANYNPAKAFNILFALEGTNSLSAGGLTAQQYIDRFEAWAAARKARGWKVVPITVPPQSTANSTNYDFNNKASAVNSVLLAKVGSLYTDVVSLGLNAKAGNFTPPSADDVAFYADGIHPTTLVHRIIGYMVADSVRYVVAGTTKPDPANYPPTAMSGEAAAFNTLTNLTLSGTTLTNTVGGQFQAYTTTTKKLAATGESFVSITTTSQMGMGFLALADTNIGGTWQQVKHAFYVEASALKVFENGGSVFADFNTVAVGTLLEIRRNGTAVTYWRNGVLFYTSQNAANYGDAVVNLILDPEAKDCRLGGALV